MSFKLSDDEDVNMLFDEIASKLITDLGYSEDSAITSCEQYYKSFTDEEYCNEIGVPVQDDDFFFHESASGIALRIYYYLNLKGDPDPHKFIEWRSSRRA